MSQFIQDYILQFPVAWQFRLGDAVDEAIKGFARDNKVVLDAIRQGVINAIGGIQWVLELIPWIVLVLGVVLLTRYLTKRWKMGVIYGLMLTFVGCSGLWSMMLQTISVVIAGVVLSLLLGFPLGVLLAMSSKANRILRPVLDTMQTMPSWVYLVPAVILFRTGSTPALLATTIYAVVPMVRMTSHGLLYVDAEMLEASRAFGSTRMQTLVKVQIPQAKPTIMAGVNQTIMMAMSMVVTCALIGNNGLGMEILVATNQVQMGRSLLPGVAIVIVAVILDRLTQAAVKRSEVAVDG